MDIMLLIIRLICLLLLFPLVICAQVLNDIYLIFKYVFVWIWTGEWGDTDKYFNDECEWTALIDNWFEQYESL